MTTTHLTTTHLNSETSPMSATEIACKVLTYLDDLGYSKKTSFLLDWLEQNHDYKAGRQYLLHILHSLQSAGLVYQQKATYGGGFAWKRTEKEWDAADPFKNATKKPGKLRGPQAKSTTSGLTESDVLKIATDSIAVWAAALEGKIEQQQFDPAEMMATLNAELDNRDKTLVNTIAAKLSKGVLKHQIAVTINSGAEVKVEGKAHPQLQRVLKLCAARLNVLLVGPAGSGKSHLARQAADCLKLPFGHISCTAGMSEGQLLGRLVPTGKAGAFEYLRSEFVRSYEEGGVFLLDEIDAADSNTLVVLNSCLANGHLAVPNRPDNATAVRHKDFVCIAAANTFGTGADRQYVGRNQLDEATLDRFRVGQVVVNYDSDLELALCPDDWLRERLQWYRKNCAAAKIRRVISTRFLREAYLSKQAGLTDDEIDESLFGGWSVDEVNKAKAGVKKPEPPKSDAHLPYTKIERSNGDIILKEEVKKATAQHLAAPQCKHGHGPMCRMASNKGWRCAVKGNKYSDHGWTVCNYCVFDGDKKGGA